MHSPENFVWTTVDADANGNHRVGAEFTCAKCDGKATIVLARKIPHDQVQQKLLSEKGWHNRNGKFFCPSCKPSRLRAKIKASGIVEQAPTKALVHLEADFPMRLRIFALYDKRKKERTRIAINVEVLLHTPTVAFLFHRKDVSPRLQISLDKEEVSLRQRPVATPDGDSGYLSGSLTRTPFRDGFHLFTARLPVPDWLPANFTMPNETDFLQLDTDRYLINGVPVVSGLLDLSADLVHYEPPKDEAVPTKRGSIEGPPEPLEIRGRRPRAVAASTHVIEASEDALTKYMKQLDHVKQLTEVLKSGISDLNIVICNLNAAMADSDMRQHVVLSVSNNQVIASIEDAAG